MGITLLTHISSTLHTPFIPSTLRTSHYSQFPTPHLPQHPVHSLCHTYTRKIVCALLTVSPSWTLAEVVTDSVVACGPIGARVGQTFIDVAAAVLSGEARLTHANLRAPSLPGTRPTVLTNQVAVILAANFPY